MNVGSDRFGQTPDGRSVLRFHLQSAGGLEVSVISYGALLISAQAPDRSGSNGEITLGFDTLEPYLGAHPYFGATVGRFANRIASGRFSLDGRDYELARNEGGRHHLHGGNRGFDKVHWEPEQIADGVAFHYRSSDGEEGYPGELEVSALYRIDDANTLILEYRARTSAPTPINLTNHTYWNLAGGGDVLDHEVHMSCGRYLPVDETLIPTGEVRPVGPAMDFSRGFRRIGERIAEVPGGYDHCYVVDRSERSPAPVLQIREPRTGRTMTVESTQPGVQLYTGNFLDGIRGRGGARYDRHAGLCVETQAFPNAVNEPAFPVCVLRPGEEYHHVTTMRLGTIS